MAGYFRGSRRSAGMAGEVTHWASPCRTIPYARGRWVVRGWGGCVGGGGGWGLGRCVGALVGDVAWLALVRVDDGRFGSGRVHRAVSILFMALRAVGSAEMPRTRRAS